MSVPAVEGRKKPPRPQKSPHVGCFLSTVLLVSVLVGASLFFLFKSGGNATGPKAHRETPTPTPTAIPTESPPPQSLFFDTFAGNSQGWSVTDDPGNTGYIRQIANRKLTLTDINPKTTLIESLPTTQVFGDCMVSVNFTIVSADPGDSVGVYVRGDSNLDHDYRVELNGDNTFDIAKEYLDFNRQPQSSILAGPGSSSAIHPLGQQNKMTIILKGPTIVLMINNNKVSSLTDSDYSSGQIALFARVSSASSGVAATFSKVEVDPVPDQWQG
jgi:Domain of Unknown Function (DUF1080)